MHRSFQRRLERGLHGVAKRVAQNYDVDDDSDSGGSNMLPGPITITVTRTLPIPSSSTFSRATTSTTPTSNDYNYEKPYQPLDTMLSSSPPSPSATTPTIKSPPPVSSGLTGNEDVDPVSGSSKPGSLPSGALIGIIILCIFICIGVIIFVVRKRYVRRRIKLRKGWANSKASQLDRSPGSVEPKPYLSPSYPSVAPVQTSMSSNADPRQAAAISFRNPEMSTVLAPPASYGNEFLAPHASSKSPLYGTPTAAVLLSSMATVVSTFITTLPDELSITTGEAVKVLAEYDDGWALCLNARGEQGMIPMECLDGRFTTPPDDITTSRGLGGNLRRVTSLQPAVGNVRRF